MILTLSTGVLDLDEGALTRLDGSTERFTAVERRLLLHLAERGGRPATREELQQEVWGYRPGILSRTVFTTVGRVRARIEADPARPQHLVTIARDGYALVVEAAGAPARRAEVPQVAGALIGREAEIKEVAALLLGETRLISLLGPGGIGKTRLAIELLRRHEGAGVFVALEAVKESTAVPAEIAKALGEGLSGSHDGWGELAGVVGEAPLLVVLDNLEHLEVAAPIGAWLGACPGLSVLATSRARLGLRAEHALAVLPLGLPASGGALGESAAGRLLLAHAHRARPGWEPGEADAALLAAICVRVGGSPLALELAAGWLRVLEPAEILGELESPEQILRALDRDVPERHRSVGVALSASWRLLAPEAAAVLEGLGVFHEPFDRASAAEVAGADLLTLGQLVDTSMIHRVGSRFHLHPLLRADARRRLAEDPARCEEVGARHARLFLNRLVEAVGALERQGDRERCLALLTPVHADVLGAWSNRARVGDVQALGAAAQALYRYLDLGNRLSELFGALAVAREGLAGAPEGTEGEAVRAALALLGAGAGGLPDEPLEALLPHLVRVRGTLRAAALVHAAIYAKFQGGIQRAIAIASDAVAASGDEPFVGPFALAVRGSMLMHLGLLDEARADLDACMARTCETRGFARALVHLGEIELVAFDVHRARAHLEEALAACRATDDRSFATLALWRLGQVLEVLGEDGDAVRVEAVEEGVCSRLPRIWWGGALVDLGRRWASSQDAQRARDGVVLLAAAASGRTMERRRAVEAALEATKAVVGPAVWYDAVREGRGATDAALLALVRREQAQAG
jgi:predicted ATPase/DNA-binding winged helix-turn-helix (wHTH) protein